MSTWIRRGAVATLLGIGICLGASAQSQTPPPVAQTGAQAAAAASSAASAPAEKKKRGSRAKTPPGKPPAAAAGACSQGSKAERQRCLNDMYGPGGPRI